MQKFRMRWAALLLCSAVAFAWGTDKTKQKSGHENEQNKAAVKQAIDEVFNKGRYELINQLYEPNCVFHQGNKTMTLSDAINDVKEWRAAAANMVMGGKKKKGEKKRVGGHWILRGGDKGRREWTNG